MVDPGNGGPREWRTPGMADLNRCASVISMDISMDISVDIHIHGKPGDGNHSFVCRYDSVVPYPQL